jgi:hypothetical protein
VNSLNHQLKERNTSYKALLREAGKAVAALFFSFAAFFAPVAAPVV